MKRTEGTYNRQDPTAWVKWENRWLTLKDITWGVQAELRLFGHTFRRNNSRIAAAVFNWFENRWWRAHSEDEVDPMTEFMGGTNE